MSDAETKRAKRKTTYHADSHAVEIEGAVFPVKQLPEASQQYFAQRGYALHLMSKDDMAAAHADAVSGKLPGTKGAAPKTDQWAEAAANVHAEQIIRGNGVKPMPGKGVRATPEYAAEKKRLLTITENWSRAQRAAAKVNPDIMAEHAKLTGVHHDASALFAPPSVAETVMADEAERETAEAA